MKNQVSQKLILYSYGGPIAWDYAHEGIPTNYILQGNEVPDIPNWWGAIVLPIFTYFNYSALLLVFLNPKIRNHLS